MNRWIFIVTACLLAAGCAQNRELKHVEKLSLPLTQKQAMDTARKTIDKMGFKLDKFDTEAGYLRTMPLRAGQFFEFWRKDNIGRFNKAEANVQNLRRTVELQFNQAGGNTGVTANVSTERLSLTEADVYGGHRAAGMYVTGGTSMQKLQLYEDSQKQWIPLETDQNLAGYVLWMIKNESDKHQEF